MVEIEPSDGGTNANLFYGSLLSQGDPSKMDTEALRESLVDLFINRVGDRIQACIKELDRPLSEIGGLQPSEFLQISNQVYPSIKNVFADYGLTITEKSRDSVVLRFMIESV